MGPLEHVRLFLGDSLIALMLSRSLDIYLNYIPVDFSGFADLNKLGSSECLQLCAAFSTVSVAEHVCIYIFKEQEGGKQVEGKKRRRDSATEENGLSRESIINGSEL